MKSSLFSFHRSKSYIWINNLRLNFIFFRIILIFVICYLRVKLPNFFFIFWWIQRIIFHLFCFKALENMQKHGKGRFGLAFLVCSTQTLVEICNTLSLNKNSPKYKLCVTWLCYFCMFLFLFKSKTKYFIFVIIFNRMKVL